MGRARLANESLTLAARPAPASCGDGSRCVRQSICSPAASRLWTASSCDAPGRSAALLPISITLPLGSVTADSSTANSVCPSSRPACPASSAPANRRCPRDSSRHAPRPPESAPPPTSTRPAAQNPGRRESVRGDRARGGRALRADIRAGTPSSLRSPTCARRMPGPLRG